MRALMPLPNNDFDPTEAAVPWKQLRAAGIDVVVATPDGGRAQADPIVLEGTRLGLFRALLRADKNGIRAYEEFAATACEKPQAYKDIDAQEYDALVLPGGHAPSMRTYLESTELRKIIAHFFAVEKIVGAVCHGVVAAARATRPDGKSVLFGRRSTALTESMELLAWRLTRRKLGDYYRTYPQTVQSEVTAALGDSGEFVTGPRPLLRDSEANTSRGFVVIDNNYISARYPGDIHRFSEAVIAALGVAR